MRSENCQCKKSSATPILFFLFFWHLRWRRHSDYVIRVHIYSHGEKHQQQQIRLASNRWNVIHGTLLFYDSHFHHIAFAERLTPSSVYYVFQYHRHAYFDVPDLVPPKTKMIRPAWWDTPDEEKVELQVQTSKHPFSWKYFFSANAMQSRECFTCNKLNATKAATWKVEPTASMHRPSSHWCMRMLSMNVSSFQVLSGFFFRCEILRANTRPEREKVKILQVDLWWSSKRYLVPVLNCFALPFCVSFILLHGVSSNEPLLI